MTSNLNAPAQRLFLPSAVDGAPVSTKPGLLVYIKPFALALAATAAISFIVAFILFGLTEYLHVEKKTTGTEINAQLTKAKPSLRIPI